PGGTRVTGAGRAPLTAGRRRPRPGRRGATPRPRGGRGRVVCHRRCPAGTRLAAACWRRQELVGAKEGRTAVRGVALAVTGVALVTLLSGCVRQVGEAYGGFGWPQGITDRAHQMYDLWVGATVTAIMVGLLVWGLIFWCVIRYRKRGDEDELPVQTRYNLPMEVLYTLTPFLVVAVLFYHTAVTQTDVNKTSPDPDVVVEVVAFKWNWQFNYRDGVGEEAQTVASTTGSTTEVPVLVLPTGQSVRFELTSRDVIHSFWVPELLFKRDVFPGNVRNNFEVIIDVDKEGAYV